MEIKEFIKETLVEVQQGVQEAINSCKESNTNGVINPVWGSANDVNSTHIKDVKFDIAVTVSDKASDNYKGGIKVMGIDIGGGRVKDEETGHVSRIQFSIPLVPPVTTVSEKELSSSS
ncbi:MAG: hypothetical protein JJU13_16570 [Balneolaceae bacterium]|nr:hypothetical protein [Balneolaceae bacterium]